MSQADIKENDILRVNSQLLNILLKDMSTGKNLLWATDNYKKKGLEFLPEREIKIELITGHHGNLIKPRTEKSKTEQQMRVRQKAEVFTPSWICNAQNNLVDSAWFGRDDVFNKETQNSWITNTEKIEFCEKRWEDYVKSKRLEISCGEAPYITSRYDAVTGEYIEVENRIGILDRKLRVVSENIDNSNDWIKYAEIAVKSIYGFDWQGDNVLIARENVLYTIEEHYEHKYGKKLSDQQKLFFAEIIVWNIWQMDGLKMVIPNSCSKKETIECDLFGMETVSVQKCEGCEKGNNLFHNGIYCKLKDWETNKILRFVDCIKN